MTDYSDLAERAEQGELASIPGTQTHGASAADSARAALLAATGADTIGDAVTIALGCPRLESGVVGGPVWKMRSTKGLDQKVSQLAKSREVSKSQILREAAAAYVRAS